MKNPEKPSASSVMPTQQHAQMALRESAAIMAPLVRWLLRNGVPYGSFTEALKPVFLEVAAEELVRGGAAVTQSALSVLSGVHRKDVRTLTAESRPEPVPAAVPLSSQVFTRWISDPAYRGADGAPRPLPRTGPAPSFDALARSASTDVHPRTVMEELLRLGLVRVEGEVVLPIAGAFVPAAGMAETVALFSASAADHLAAAVHNLTLDAPKFLEQSVFATGLTEVSAQQLAALSRDAWAQAFARFVALANERVDADANADGAHRVRFGAYFYSEPEPGAAATSAASGAADAGAPGAKETQ